MKLKSTASIIRFHGGLSLTELRVLRLNRKEMMDFSSNLNPLGIPLGVKKALEGLDLSCYPDPENLELKEALAPVAGVQPDQIVIGNGSTELIYLLAHAFLKKRDVVVILTPTFGEYEIAARLAQTKITVVPSEENKRFIWDTKKVSQQIKKCQPAMVFLCNPNNPTGVYIDRAGVEIILSSMGKGLLVLDEAYITFVQNSWNACELLSSKNVVILRSLTKNYALAGLRLGYALCPSDVAKILVEYQPTWSVNLAAQVAGAAALTEDQYLLRSKNSIEEGKDYLQKSLEGLGYKVFPSAANFLLVKVGDAPLLRYHLLTKGICVRDCSSFGLPEYIRIGVRTVEECKQLISGIKEVMLDQQK
ncbi:MAG TPA: histidinol-phosphate transaminase [Thermodesulfobacteriota bacterium]|nr:histidinol-phosphate transaminase [Thermodesulfobacteriota bacterium]